MEKSITTLKSNTHKNKSSSNTNLSKKTKENTELIHELTELRIHKKELESELDARELVYQKLYLEYNRRTKDGGRNQ